MKKLVVLGGGFAGAKIAKTLENKFEVTLVDGKDYFEFTPGTIKTIVNPAHTKSIQVLHTSYLKKARVITDCVKEVKKDKITLSKNKEEIKFDYLVLCLGSRYNSPFKEKDLVILTRGNHIRNYYDKLCDSSKIVIIGGGIVGVEIAGEIISKYKDKEITIIHKHDKLIERNREMAINYANKFLLSKGVKIIFNEKAIKYTEKIVETDKGTKIKTDLVLLCTGIKPNSEPLEKNFINSLEKDKKIKVNEFLQVKSYNNIFAAGDITNINEEKLAQNAEKQADIVVKNIIHLEEKSDLEKYIPKSRITVISLGKFNGILQYKNIVLNGFIPGILKHIIEWKTMIRYKSRFF